MTELRIITRSCACRLAAAILASSVLAAPALACQNPSIAAVAGGTSSNVLTVAEIAFLLQPRASRKQYIARAVRYARRSDVGAQTGIARYNKRMSFLVPSGPFGVGSVTRELIDRGRPSHLLSETAGRRLYLKVWYPAERGTGDDDEQIWQDLRNDDRTPAFVRVLLGCMRARTATRVNGRFVARAPTSRLVAYNHGLVSFAAENTSLMQELASHGCTVVAIQHAEQLAEFKALSRADSAEKKKADAELAQRLKDAPAAERPVLGVEYFQASTNTNRVVVERAADTSFVLGHIANVVAKIPSLRANAIDTSSAHLVGYSLGGAVATETAKRDARALSVVNLDGGMYGTLDTKAPSQPYLMLYSSANDGMNDKLLPQHSKRVTPPDTTHLNYHDVAGLVPLLRLVRMTGRTNPRAFLEERNRLVREFCFQSA